jgi:hypothetical protein
MKFHHMEVKQYAECRRCGQRVETEAGLRAMDGEACDGRAVMYVPVPSPEPPQAPKGGE